jgi:hypothetical protein
LDPLRYHDPVRIWRTEESAECQMDILPIRGRATEGGRAPSRSHLPEDTLSSACPCRSEPDSEWFRKKG